MRRTRDLSLPHAGGLLFQQYACDGYSKAEAFRLAYFRQHQDTLRAESYQRLYDAVQAGQKNVGAVVVLPATYPGSPRAMNQNYMDAMSIVRKYGKPDFSITMTANPAWPEIIDNLPPAQAAHDAPDLVARVFHTKLGVLLDLLLRHDVLGKVVAYTG